MFPLQPIDELVFGQPTISKRDKIWDDLVEDHAFMGSNIINFSTSSNNKQEGQTAKLGFQKRQTERKNESIITKVLHKEIERKRRQEMSQLNASLRALLPPDQIKEAVNYIQHKQKKIEELRIRRDKLTKSSNLSSTRVASPNGGDYLPNLVTLNPIEYGVEILIKMNKRNSGLGLSKVLAELVERELNVVSCVSTTSKGSFLHKIHAEAMDIASLDFSLLQEKLSNAVN